MSHAPRIGIDLGGTKIEGVVIDEARRVSLRRRIPTPKQDYEATLAAIVGLVESLEREAGVQARVGLGTPGAWDPVRRTMKNCNSTWLNGRSLLDDVQSALARDVRIANDADCLALSEALDGAGRGAMTLFAVILGTGVGGGIVVRGELVTGPNAIAGEWGHTPLSYWPDDPQLPPDMRALAGRLTSRTCYCGRANCIETFLSGPGLARTHLELWSEPVDVAALPSMRTRNAEATLELYAWLLGRSLAQIVNVLDPHVIVLGGGLSNLRHLYRAVPAIWGAYVFSPSVETRLVPAELGDSSGVMGAACLWPARL
jgi:fructokinase